MEYLVKVLECERGGQSEKPGESKGRFETLIQI